MSGKDYEAYFIVVADMVHYAKRNMLVGLSRGSATNSLVWNLKIRKETNDRI
jgi:DNA polymerase III alpha subunit